MLAGPQRDRLLVGSLDTMGPVLSNTISTSGSSLSILTRPRGVGQKSTTARDDEGQQTPGHPHQPG